MAIIMDMCSYVIEEKSSAESIYGHIAKRTNLDSELLLEIRQSEEIYNIGRNGLPISLTKVDIENFLQQMSAGDR